MFQKVLFCVTVIYSAYAIPIDTGYGGFADYGGFHGGAAIAAAPIAVQHVQPAIVKQLVAAEPVNPNPNYSFSYGVNDPHTGDAKEAQEILENGVVHGSYSLAEPDGSIRKVTYTADDHNGFNAVVQKIGGAKAVAVAPVAKVFAQPAYVAPALSKTIAYAAPAYAAPTYSKYLSGGFIH